MWVEQVSHFYLQHACANLRHGQSEIIDELLDVRNIDMIQQWFEGLFGCAFRGAHLTVSAHRLTPGEGIGVHTDRPANGTETHRLVVHLNRRFEDGYGGHLLLLGGRELEDLQAIVRPMHNSAVGFGLSERSWHAVNDISGGTRYSLIFGLWQVGADCEHAGGAHGLGSKEGALLELLCQLRARELPHSGRTLMDHLLGTGRILRRWGCDSSVCLAGMSHSIYGTPGFRRTLLDEDGRNLLRATIGRRSEGLAWLFGRVDRLGLNLAFRGDSSIVLRDFSHGGVLPITTAELSDLAVLSWANTLEQDLALAARGQAAHSDPTALAQLLDETGHALPETARAELRRVYG